MDSERLRRYEESHITRKLYAAIEMMTEKEVLRTSGDSSVRKYESAVSGAVREQACGFEGNGVAARYTSVEVARRFGPAGKEARGSTIGKCSDCSIHYGAAA